MHDLTGVSIGRYHVLERLGQGGMAVVYKAYDTRLEREVALKVIRTDAFAPAVLDRLLKRFEREAKAQAKLTHPNIVKVYDYGEHEGSPYLVMELLSGGTLKQKLGKPLPYLDAARLLAPVAQALASAHREGILHRDVKPSNILLTPSGEPVLTDFGIAKLLEEDEGHTLTGTGVGVGTPEYMAPEQGLGKEVDGRVDVYSLGVVFYELVTGRKPFTADTPLAVLYKQMNDPLPRPKEIVPGLPGSVEKVIFKALAKKPEDRYPDMAAFAQALERLELGREEGPTRRTSRPDRGEPEPVVEETRDEIHSKVPSRIVQRKGSRVKKVRWWKWAGSGLLGIALVGWVIVGVVIPGVEKSRAEAAVRTASAEQTILAAAQQLEAAETGTARAEQTGQASALSLARTSTAAAWIPTSTRTNIPVVTPTLGIGSTRIREADGMVQVYVPVGEFEMGSEDGDDDEQPVHKVFLDAYWIDKYEVTNAQYMKCVEAGACTEPEKRISSTRPSYFGDPAYADYPVIFISWYAAENYCAWTGDRLPTEAEWEKAARGMNPNIYPWGNLSPDCTLANFGDCIGDTSQVGSHFSNVSPYNILDMAGNVSEWVSDWYLWNYYNTSITNNPVGPSSGTNKVLRGGGWHSDMSSLRTTFRNYKYPNNSSSVIGFRCASSAYPGSASSDRLADSLPFTAIYTVTPSSRIKPTSPPDARLALPLVPP